MLGTGTARWYSSFIFLVCLGIGYAQSTTPVSTPTTQTESGPDDSLAAVARRTKAQKDRHAKKTVTDDDLHSSSDPLPRLKYIESSWTCKPNSPGRVAKT